MKTILPNKKFIEKWSRMTDNNEHGLCYESVAKWCYNHCPFMYDKNKFGMLKEIFHGINKFHNKVGFLPDITVRYELGKKLDEYILNCFGEKTLEEINKGR